MLRSFEKEYPSVSAVVSANSGIDSIVKAAVAVMCLHTHHAVDKCLKRLSSCFELPTESEEKTQDEIDDLLGEVCCSSGKSFAGVPNNVLAESIVAYKQDIESGSVKVQGKTSMLKRLNRVLQLLENSASAAHIDVLPSAEKDLKGWMFSSNDCVSVLMFIEECFTALNIAKLPSGAVRFQLCEAAALQCVNSVSQINILFQKIAAKFSIEKGMERGLMGGLEVLKDLGKDGTKVLKNLVVGDDTDASGDLMGEVNQETQDRQELWLREKGNIALIQCINDCQCLHEMSMRHIENIVTQLLPAPVAKVLGELAPGDYASTDIHTQQLSALVYEAYETCAYPLPDELGLNALEALPPSMTAASHFRRPLIQMEVVWRDMCKIVANRIGLGLEDLLNRFLKKMVYRLQHGIQDRKDQYEEHCKQFYVLVDDCMDEGEDSSYGETKGRRDRQALLVNIRDDLMTSFYSKSLIGLIDNMRHAVEICLVQDLYALITQILSTMIRDRCRFCVSPPQYSGLSKFFRAILQGFEDLFLGRRAEKVLSALPQAWVDQHTAFLKEEISLMAIDSTQLIRIANAPPDSMDNKTSFGVSRSQIATGILIARKADKKAVQYSVDTSSKAANSVDLIEAALLGRVESHSKKSNEHGFVAQSLTKTYKKGWMVKEGQLRNSWKKRWFLLQGQELSYFEDQNEQNQKGVIKLSSDTQVLPMQRPKQAGHSLFSQVSSCASSCLCDFIPALSNISKTGHCRQLDIWNSSNQRRPHSACRRFVLYILFWATIIA
jgi:hypothetical protein